MDPVATAWPLVMKGLLALLAGMFILWAISVKVRNAGIVDIGWALGLVYLTWLYVNKGGGYPLRSSLLLIMVTAWGMRLSYLLTMRLLRDPGEDKRYQRIRQDWKTNIEAKFLGLFLFEAVLDVILAVPFLLIAINPRPHLLPIEIFGILVWAIGLAGEAMADEQLKKFKADPNNRGRTCQSGLWYYSRHPNYFFEWLMWAGYFIFALGSPWGWGAVISPMIMFAILRYGTGVPLSEAQALQSRGEEYQRYQRTTSVFVPLPKRKI